MSAQELEDDSVFLLAAKFRIQSLVVCHELALDASTASWCHVANFTHSNERTTSNVEFCNGTWKELMVIDRGEMRPPLICEPL